MTKTRRIRLETGDEAAARAACAEVLAAGGLCLLPTETVYGLGARADLPEAVLRMRELKGGRGDSPFTLHLGESATALARGRVSRPAKRLAGAFWPGPLTLVLDAKDANDPLCAPDATLGLRVVKERFTRSLLREAPLLMTSANPSGVAPPRSCDEALALVDGRVELAIDAGACALGGPSSVVRVEASGKLRVLREGLLDERRIHEEAAALVIFLCSGNTCRSPMAEGLARARWAKALGVDDDALLAAGLWLTSAGCGTRAGLPPSPHAVEAMQAVGVEIGAHRSQPLSTALLARAKRVFCMGFSHLMHAAALSAAVDAGEEAGEIALLAGDSEIPDPFGGGLEGYVEVRERIAAALPDEPPLDDEAAD